MISYLTYRSAGQEARQEAERLLRSLPHMYAKSPKFRFSYSPAFPPLAIMLEAYPALISRSPKEVSVLDVGCGASPFFDGKTSRKMPILSPDTQGGIEPNFARALVALGYSVTGIDVSATVLQEPFETRCLDFLVDSLPRFARGSFDVVIANMVCGPTSHDISPDLAMRHGGPYGALRFQERLDKFATPILRAGGVTIVSVLVQEVNYKISCASRQPLVL